MIFVTALGIQRSHLIYHELGKQALSNCYGPRELVISTIARDCVFFLSELWVENWGVNSPWDLNLTYQHDWLQQWHQSLFRTLVLNCNHSLAWWQFLIKKEDTPVSIRLFLVLFCDSKGSLCDATRCCSLLNMLTSANRRYLREGGDCICWVHGESWLEMNQQQSPSHVVY